MEENVAPYNKIETSKIQELKEGDIIYGMLVMPSQNGCADEGYLERQYYGQNLCFYYSENNYHFLEKGFCHDYHSEYLGREQNLYNVKIGESIYCAKR